MIINFRQPEPYVEIDGVRKPLSEYPDLKVLRYHDQPIPGLVEVNLLTGWITLRRPAPYQPWLTNPDTPEPTKGDGEWQETTSNLRISGMGEHDVVITGCDMRLAKRPVTRVTPRPAPAPARPVTPSKPRTPVGTVEGISLPTKTAPPGARPVEPMVIPPPPPPIPAAADAVDFLDFSGD